VSGAHPIGRRGRPALAAALALSALAACTDQAKAPAEAALRAADAAVTELGGDVTRYAPEQVKAALAAHAAAKERMARKDYKGALAAAGEVPPKVKEAVAAAAARKTELAKAWGEAARDVPNLLYAVEDRLDILADAKKLPAGLDKDGVAWARAELASIQSTWPKVAAEADKGDLAAATAKARDLGRRAREVLSRIGLP
jgi:hypothetical protein